MYTKHYIAEHHFLTEQAKNYTACTWENFREIKQASIDNTTKSVIFNTTQLNAAKIVLQIVLPSKTTTKIKIAKKVIFFKTRKCIHIHVT